MKKKLVKKLIMLLALLIMIPVVWNGKTSIASAAKATPKFAKGKIELVGAGEVYQIEITNKVAKSKYKWTSSNKAVVKVSSKGLLTTVGGGTATVKCVITYPTKKTKTLSCSVKVTIPAEEIRIVGVEEVNGAYVMQLNSTVDLNYALVPANSTDKTYWYITRNEEAGFISIDNPTEGIITAKKVGKVSLSVAAVAKASAADAKKSIFNDAIIIEVVAPTATVSSADIISTTELQVKFDSPVKPDTVLGLNGQLSPNIEILRRTDTKKVLAADPGTLTGSLSTDGKILTITSSATFGGEYKISCSKNILTTTGVAIEEFNKNLTFIDNYPPTFVGTTLDDSGFKATINFSEPMDFSGLSVANPTVLDGSSMISSATSTILGSRTNYIASADKKSLEINLTNIASTDYGKRFMVTMAGLKDMAGNYPITYTISVDVRTDNSKKPQAVPIMVTRTGYYTLTATFSRSISYAGFIQIKNGSMIPGEIDTTDNKKVNYRLTEYDAAMTGYNMVKVMMWNSYNVIENDRTAQDGQERSIDFSIDKSNPALISFEYDITTTTLTLTFNKEVSLATTTGVFTTSLTTISGEIKPGSNVTYTTVPGTDKKIIKMKLNNISVLGSYTIKLPYGFVSDNYRNPSLARDIVVSNTTGTSTELPAPHMIYQEPSNLNQIVIEFGNRLDEASARNPANYSIPGATIESVYLNKNTSNEGATVFLYLTPNSINTSVERPVNINGVLGYNNSFTPIVGFTKMVMLKDNTKPYMMGSPTFDATAKNIVRINFNEQITGDLVVRVTMTNNTAVIMPQDVTISGNSANIVFDYQVASQTSMKIEILENTLVDTSGNKAALEGSYFVGAFY